jgi:hypothetical protein
MRLTVTAWCGKHGSTHYKMLPCPVDMEPDMLKCSAPAGCDSMVTLDVSDDEEYMHKVSA